MKPNNNQFNQLIKSEDRTDHSDLQALPDEVKLLIFSYLDPKSSLAAAVASPRAWYPLINDAEIWRQRIAAQFPYLRELKKEDFESAPRSLYLEERDFIREYRNKYNDNESLLIEIASGNLDIITSQQLNEDDRERLFCFAAVYGRYDPHLLKLDYKVSALQIAVKKGVLKTVINVCESLEGEKQFSFAEIIEASIYMRPIIDIELYPIFLVAINEALSHQQVEMAEYLMTQKSVTYGSEVNIVKQQVLSDSAFEGYDHIIRYLLDSSSNLLDLDSRGKALVNVCLGEKVEVAKLLWESLSNVFNGRNIEAINQYRVKALCSAVRNLPLLECLYEKSKFILTVDIKSELMQAALSVDNQESITWLQSKLNSSKRCSLM